MITIYIMVHLLLKNTKEQKCKTNKKLDLSKNKNSIKRMHKVLINVKQL